MKLLIALVAALFVGMGVSAQTLKTAAQDSAPKFIEQTSEGKRAIVGICIDVLRAIERLDPSIKFTGDQKFVPVDRYEQYLKDGEIDVMAGMVKNDQRAAIYTYIDPPIYIVRNVIVVLAKDDAVVPTLDSLARFPKTDTVIVQRGTAQVDELEKIVGIGIESGARDADTALRMLLAKRGRFIYGAELSLLDAIKKGGYQDKVRILDTSFRPSGRYIAFSKKVPEATMAKVRVAMEKLQASGELKSIFDKYLK